MELATAPKASEKETQKAILQYLELRHFCFRNNTGASVSEYNGKRRFFRYGKVGSGDILGIQRPGGRFFSIEVKAQGKKPTPAQLEFMGQVNGSGGLAFVAYSVEDVLGRGL